MKILEMETKDGKGISYEVRQEETSLKLSREEVKEMDFLIINVSFFSHKVYFSV